MFNNQQQFAPLDLIVLLFILGLAFFIMFIPHQNYPFLVHGDEWVHLAYSEALLEAGNINFIDPFFGDTTLGLASNFETGFHIFLVAFRLITDISWVDIFMYLPSFIFMITVLTVYNFSRREGYGWEAAFFACFIPTTIGILGPAFLVPVAMGLTFLPVLLFLVFNFKTWPTYLLLFICSLFLLIMHPPSAIIILIVSLPFALLNIGSNPKHSLGMSLAMVLPTVISMFWASSISTQLAENLLTPHLTSTYITIPSILYDYGYIPLIFSFFGIIFLLIRGGTKNFGFILGLGLLVTMLLIYFRFHYGIWILYERGLLYLMLILSIIAGAGLAQLNRIKLPIQTTNKFLTLVARYLVITLCLFIVGLLLAINIPIRQQTNYYHMINNEDYQAFTWIKDNIDKRLGKAILNPWKATAFSALTQQNIYTRIHTAPSNKDDEAYDFLREGCVDTKFLRENNIQIIYNEYDCDNADLIKVRQNVYLLLD